MILRKAKKEDFIAYSKLEQEFYSHHKRYGTLLQDINPKRRDLNKEFNKLMKGRDFFRLVEDKGVVIGYIYGLIKNVGENEKGWRKVGELNSILVTKSYRKKGVSRMLVKEFFGWLKKKKITYVESSCNVKNQQAIEFHKNLKFKEQHLKFGKVL